MKTKLLLLLLILFSLKAYNQTIKGTILDKDTKQPIDFAVAYFAGSFIGTNADKNGNFELDISKSKSIPLTISALGYYSVTLTDFSPAKNLMIYLVPKDYELNEIVIKADNSKKAIREREKNLKLFRNQFIGETPNARLCRILNEDDITLSVENDILKAFASKPIRIDNQALGYSITFFLDKFEYDLDNRLMYLKGDILFTSDLNLNNSEAAKYERRRRYSWLGSRMHFFRSLWDNQLDEEGFVVTDSTNAVLSRSALVSQSDSQFERKYFKYRGKLMVKYGSESQSASVSNLLRKTGGFNGSRLDILNDSVSFDRNGISVEGIRWYGRIAQQRVADYLPVEYDPKKAVAVESDQQQKLRAKEISSVQMPVRINTNNELSNDLPSEKVYLHLDRPNFIQGDTIWFKAYSWFGFEQIPDTVSKVLYVELLNPKDGVELRKKLLIENGTSKGEFILDRNISPGRYVIRAYTRWMQNDNTGEPFYWAVTISSQKETFQADCSPVIIKQPDGDSLKAIFRFYEINAKGDIESNLNHRIQYSVRIGDKMFDSGQDISSIKSEQVFKCKLPETGAKDSVAVLRVSVKDQNLTFEKEFRIPLKEEIDFQFFPEGGSLVNGLESKVAFKATGTDGLSREVKGTIKDSDEKVITSFESSHKGMGEFRITPEKDKKYSASVESGHRIFNFSLPQAKDEGIVMSAEFSENRDTARLSVKYSPAMENRQFYVTGSAYGKLRFISLIKTTPDSSAVSVPINLLPEGISRLTLIGGDFKPLCERLIYNERVERFRVEVVPDSVNYTTRSMITLQLKTTGGAGEPVPADLSLAVVDKEQATSNNRQGGISAYKLLQSELKGKIEEPDDYFKGDSVNQKALDLLLLTQGYRRFLSDSTASKEIKYYPERSFEVKGKLELRRSSGKEKKFDYSTVGLTFLSPSGTGYFDLFSPDSTGNFSFQAPLVYGRQLSLLKAALDKGRSFKGTIPKGKMFLGDIMLDEPEMPKFKIPPPPKAGITSPAIEYIQRLQAAKKTEASIVNDSIKWHLNLPEFTIKGKDKEWYTRFEDEAKKIVDMDSIDPSGRKYVYINDLLIREFGAREHKLPLFKTIYLPSGGNTDWYYPIYLLNGQVFVNAGEDSLKFYGLLNMLYSIRVNEIKTLMVIPPGNITYHYADSKILMPPVNIKQSMVVIETYSKGFRGDPDGLKTFILEGLDTPSVFYSPLYDGPAKESKLYDGRATLYWNPTIRTDQNGEAKVEFFTGDRKTEMEVIVNGIGIGKGHTGELHTKLLDKSK